MPSQQLSSDCDNSPLLLTPEEKIIALQRQLQASQGQLNKALQKQ